MIYMLVAPLGSRHEKNTVKYEQESCLAYPFCPVSLRFFSLHETTVSSTDALRSAHRSHSACHNNILQRLP